jgi:hypothetical protein
VIFVENKWVQKPVYIGGERERERERRNTHSSLALQLRGKTVLCSEEGD